jgi:hypothetical protein
MKEKRENIWKRMTGKRKRNFVLSQFSILLIVFALPIYYAIEQYYTYDRLVEKEGNVTEAVVVNCCYKVFSGDIRGAEVKGYLTQCQYVIDGKSYNCAFLLKKPVPIGTGFHIRYSSFPSILFE